ncbi:MAG: PilX N-terminal domain-containing pilus assembly protein, partial [Burkholderiales bacterium]
MRARSLQRGAVLIMAVVLIVVIAALVTAISFFSTANIGSSGNHRLSSQAFFIASSGLERALFQFSRSGVACAALTNVNLAVGAGSFSTTGTLYPIAATSAILPAGGITAAATTIPVTVTVGAFANYAPHGRIRIELEEIDYSGTSTSVAVCGAGIASCFIGARRAANGTAAAAHAAAVAVFQDNQCLI